MGNKNTSKEEERRLARKLQDVFPDAQRNFEDRVGAGYDIENTDPFRFQLKYGHQPSPYKALEEAVGAADDTEYGVGVCRFRYEARKDPENKRKSLEFAVLRLDDLIELLGMLKQEKIL